jgi:hypothetical protein
MKEQEEKEEDDEKGRIRGRRRRRKMKRKRRKEVESKDKVSMRRDVITRRRGIKHNLTPSSHSQFPLNGSRIQQTTSCNNIINN